MKNTILIVLLSLIGLNFAYAECIGEAEIIAKVVNVKTNKSSCTVSIGEVSFFRYNQLCPMSIVEPIQAGIEVKTTDGQGCNFAAGQDISGVIAVGADGLIYLDK